ncbi:SirB2 family protein [Halomonas faecis]|uniref:SirB2 family protein n=1 Tax=Halomonas faecis TaxID=1562110 RepID=UPI00387EB9F0
MLEYYLPIKHLHLLTVTLSLAFFLVRAVWSVRQASILQRRWVKVLPHVNDTLLLTFGILLMVMLSMWPHQHLWLAAKLVALLLYIGLGTLAIKRGRRPVTRAVAAVAAVAAFAYMVGAAVAHHPLSWLAILSAG